MQSCDIFSTRTCNFLSSTNHPIKRCSIVVVYAISNRAKNVSQWLRFRYNTMDCGVRRCLPKNDFFQNNIRQIFLLKKKLPQKSTDVGPSNFFVSANHSLKRCKVVIVCTISNRAENDGPLKCLGCTMVAYE